MEEAKRIYECISNAKSYNDALEVIIKSIELNQDNHQINESVKNMQMKGY